MTKIEEIKIALVNAAINDYDLYNRRMELICHKSIGMN